MSTACNISLEASTYEEQPTPPLFWLGVIITLVGSTITPLGMNLQRLGQLQLAKRGKSNLCTSPIWMIGLLVFVCGNTCDAIALAMAPQSVITPLGCVSLVSNLFIARLVLKEVLTSRVVVGSLVVMLGVVGIVFPASQAEECIELRESLDTLLARWRKPAFVIFAALQFTLLVCVTVVVTLLERKMQREAATTSSAAVGPLTRHLSTREKSRLKLGYPVLIGLIATWTVLFVKCAGELITAAVGADGELSHLRDPAAYALIAGLLVSVPCQLTYLNRALCHFEALWVIPSLQCFWSLSSITMGAVFFDEFAAFAPWMYASFLGGVTLSLSGIAIVATSEIASEHPDSSPHGAALLPQDELLGAAVDDEQAAAVP